MKLSCLLNNMEYEKEYELIKDKDFETLGLVASVVDKSMCTFIENEKYIRSISNNVNMIITTKSIYESNLLIGNYGICLAERPKNMFFKIHNFLKDDISYAHNNFETKIGLNCIISEKASIAKNNVIIGDNCIIEDFAVIKENTVIGNNVVIRSSSIISREGFEFKSDDDIFFHVNHLGKVIIGDNVEIQDLTCVDRAIYPWDSTIIGVNSKIDCLCQIGHGAKIGKNALIAGSNTIGGRSIVGDNVITGGRVSIMHGGLKIGDNAFIGLGSVVIKNVKKSERVFGNPAKKVF